MTGKTSPAKSPIRRNPLLLVGLAIVALTYLASLPWQRHMTAETARIEHETATRQADADQATKQKSRLETAKEAEHAIPAMPEYTCSLHCSVMKPGS